MMRTRKAGTLALAAAIALAGLGISGCQSSEGQKTDTVTLLTHDSFALPDDVKAQFTKDTGLKLKVVPADSGTQMVSKLALTKGAPTGDAVYGLSSADLGLVKKQQILQDADVKGLPADADLQVEGVAAYPVDRGDVCVNIDTTYFKAKGVAEPATLDDLAKPEYKDLIVTPNPATSATGQAFMYATIAKYGDTHWLEYWKKLKANGLKVVAGWSEAYEQDFSQGSGKGPRPIVVSYASSPAATVSKDGSSATSKALPDTCLRVAEYAGVLAGAKNPQGAAKVIDWLRSKKVQQALPDSMYMFPVADVALPQAWQKFAPMPAKDRGFVLDPAKIAANREGWLRDFQDLF